MTFDHLIRLSEAGDDVIRTSNFVTVSGRVVTPAA